MTYYTQNTHKDTIRKLLELINEFSKPTAYKINTQKYFAFLYTNNKKSGREIKETIPFTIATKRIKYLGINLPKETNDLYAANYETLMKDLRDNTNRSSYISWSSIGRINIVTMTILLQKFYRFNAIPIQLPVAFFRARTKNFIIWMETQKSLNSQSYQSKLIFRKKKGAGGINLPDFRIYYKATVVKSMVLARKTKNTDQWNKIESPEIKPHTYGHLIFDKGGKNIQWRKENLFNKHFAGNTGQLHVSNETGTPLHIIQKKK